MLQYPNLESLVSLWFVGDAFRTGKILRIDAIELTDSSDEANQVTRYKSVEPLDSPCHNLQLGVDVFLTEIDAIAALHAIRINKIEKLKARIHRLELTMFNFVACARATEDADD